MMSYDIILFRFIFALLAAWPVASSDDHPLETVAVREERYETIALATDVVSGGDPEKVAFILTVWKRESQFAYWIHSGEVKGDHGKANCMGSVHPSRVVLDWPYLAGTTFVPTIRCALRTIQGINSGLFLCARDAKGTERDALAFEYYARGHCHSPPSKESTERAILKKEIDERLRNAQANAHLR